MEGARRLSASRNAARPEPRPAHRRRINVQPEFEQIMRSQGDLLEAVRSAMKAGTINPELGAGLISMLKLSGESGLRREIESNKSQFAGSGNVVVLLNLKRTIDFLKSKNPDAKRILSLESKAMDLDHSAADSMLPVLTGIYDMLGKERFDKMSDAQILDMVATTLKESPTFCPKAIRRTFRKKAKRGDFNHVSDMVKVSVSLRREDASLKLASQSAIEAAPWPAMADFKPQQFEPQPAAEALPTYVQKTDDTKGTVVITPQTMTSISPLQVWEEVRKIREGEKKSLRKPFVVGRVREKPADKKRMKPPQAAPARIIKLKQARPVPAPVHAKPTTPKAQKLPEKKRDLPPTATLETAPAPAQASAEATTPKDKTFHLHQPLIIVPDPEKKTDDKPGPSDKSAGAMGVKVKRKPKKKRSRRRIRKKHNPVTKKKPEAKKKPKKKKVRKKKTKKKPARKAKPKARRKPRKKAGKKAKTRKKTKAKLRPKKNSKVKRSRKRRKAAKKRLSAKRKKALKTAKKRKSRRKKAPARKKKAGERLIRRFRAKKKRKRRRKAA